MKKVRFGTLCLASVLIGSLLPSLIAAPPAKEGLPPGLQKKDKLPPGWQKKVGNNSSPDDGDHSSPATGTNQSGSGSIKPPANPNPTSSTPPSSTTKPPETVKTTPVTPPPSTPNPKTDSPVTTNPALAKPLTREQRENLARMERALSDLEIQAVRPGAADRLLHRLSNKQNISVTTLQSHLKNHPGLSVPHLYLASIIAREGKVPTEQILQARKAGTSWSDLARTYKVPFSDLAERLRTAEELAKEAANDEQAKARREAQRQ